MYLKFVTKLRTWLSIKRMGQLILQILSCDWGGKRHVYEGKLDKCYLASLP